MTYRCCALPDLLALSMPEESDLLDLIEWAFLDRQIDGETLSLAFAWVESNDVQVH